MVRSRSAIALDFGGHSVKALQLEGRGERLRVQCAHAVRIATSPGQTPAERRASTIAAGQRLLRDGSFRGRSAVVCLRLAALETRRIRIPTEKLPQAGEIIAREVQDQGGGSDLSILPIQVADLFDHGEMKREFLCCIAKAAAIDDLIQLTEAVGLVPEAIDLEPCAQVRPFARLSQHECFLHLDIGRHDTRLTVVRAGVTVLMKSAAVGSEAMLATLAKRLEMDRETLLELGAVHGDQRDLCEAVTGALAEPLEVLLLAISSAVRYVGALFQGRAVTLLRLAGGTAELPGLAAYLGRRIGITTELADPFTEIGTDAMTIGVFGTRSQYCTTMGLALRGIA